MVIAIVIDIDDCTPREAISRCLAIDRPPTAVVETPGGGAHVWYELAEPLWLPRSAGGDLHPRALVLAEWARAVQAALTEALGGDPMSIGLGNLRRNPLRYPTLAGGPRWELTKLALPTVCARSGRKALAGEGIPDGKTLYALAASGCTAHDICAAYAGTPIGMRNAVCWRLCVASLLAARGNVEEATRAVMSWARTCKYPADEVAACIRWAVRSRIVCNARDRGWQLAKKPVSTRTRTVQADYARACRGADREAAIRREIARMEADGEEITINRIKLYTGSDKNTIKRVLCTLAR